MLKSYKQFINENVLEPIDDGLSYFIKVAIDNRNAENNMLKSYLNSSYSLYTKNYMKDDVYNELEQFANDTIIDLNNTYGEDAIQTYINTLIDTSMTDNYGIENGISDIIFNKYNSDFPLGSSDIFQDDDRFIKYVYGWHKSKYGQLKILQEFDSIKDFSEDIIDQLETFLDYRTDNYAVSGSLILIENDVAVINDSYGFDFLTYYKDSEHIILEVLNSDKQKISTSKNWIEFHDKASKIMSHKEYLSVDWPKISGGVIKENQVKSTGAINKFKL